MQRFIILEIHSMGIGRKHCTNTRVVSRHIHCLGIRLLLQCTPPANLAIRILNPNVISHFLSSMLNDLANKLAICVNVCTDLLRYGSLFRFVAIHGAKINTSAFAGQDLGIRTLFAQVHSCLINLVHQQRWEGLIDLQLKVYCLDYIN